MDDYLSLAQLLDPRVCNRTKPFTATEIDRLLNLLMKYIPEDDDLEADNQGINSPLDHVNLLLFAEEALRALGSSTFGASLQSSLPPPIMRAIAEVFASSSEARQGGQVTGSLGPARKTM